MYTHGMARPLLIGSRIQIEIKSDSVQAVLLDQI